MRRLVIALVAALMLPISPATSQYITNKDPSVGGKTWPGAEAGVAGYNVFRKGKAPVEMRTVVEKRPWYHFTDPTGKRTSQLIDSIDRIEPILQADLDSKAEALRVEAARKAEDDRKFEEAKRVELAKLAAQREASAEAARETARMTARTEAPTGYRSSYSGSSSVHVGPRGGIYHYSASGKKVYHKR